MKIRLLLLLGLWFTFSATAQDQKKPKVGLVLSGGGAKGLAHIGVLKVLEDAGVDISYISGTSMGAIVGGLYASGYSAGQLDSIFRAVDSDALLQDYIPRSSKNFFEKRNDEVYALTLPFNKFKIEIPTALSKGLYNYNLLTRLTHHVRHVRNFQQLPIPFVCIATDIENGEEVIMKQGVLAKAILASGAFPSLYAPVEIDGKLLIDGGVVNNYPVEEVKKMGADIIIGVDVQEGLKERENLRGAMGVLVQITNFGMIEKMETKRKLTDIYIKPDINGYSVISFNDGVEIVKKGEEAAFAVYEQLRAIGVISAKQHSSVKAITLQDSLVINAIKISPLKNFTPAYVIGKLRFREKAKIPYGKLDSGIGNLNSTQNFSSISYSFEKNGNGDRLVVDLKENPVNTYLKLGLHYDGLYKSALLLNLTHKKLLFKNDVISTDVIIGDNIRYNVNYYLDNGFYWSYGLNLRYNAFARNIQTDFASGRTLQIINAQKVDIDFSDFTGTVYAQTVFAQRFLMGAGAELKHLKIKSENIQNELSVIDNSTYFSLYGYLKYDTLDKLFFPTKGFRFVGDFKSFLHSTDYQNNFENLNIAKADLQFVHTLFKNLAVKIQSEGGFRIGERSVASHDFVIGGYGFTMINNFRHFYGYDFLSLSGDSYVKGEVGIDYEFYKKNHLNFNANYANIGFNIFESDLWISRPKYSGYAFGYGFETFLGPVEIKHSWSPETRDHHTWFSVGFWF